MTKTHKEFADQLADESFFDEYIQDSYWSDSFRAAKCEEMMKSEAKQRNITLTKEDDFDGDKFFHELYQATEKGLS